MNPHLKKTTLQAVATTNPQKTMTKQKRQAHHVETPRTNIIMVVANTKNQNRMHMRGCLKAREMERGRILQLNELMILCL
jgi:hypothetical protein